MRVLLIHAYLGRVEPYGLLYPIAIVNLGTVLQTKGHEVYCLDPNINNGGFDAIAEAVRTFKPEIVGISQRNVDTTQIRDPYLYLKTLQPTVNIVKQISPETTVIVGGAAYSLFAEKIVQRTPGIDFGVYQEAEESLPELLDNLHQPEKVKGIIIRNEDGSVNFTGPRLPPELSQLPRPNRDLIDPRFYFDTVGAIGIETKRGCSLKCVYCSYPFLNGAKVRQKSPEEIADEIQEMKKKYDIPSFMFLDSVFNLPNKHAEQICEELVKRNNKVPWTAWFDMRGINKEILELGKAAGCKQYSFSPDALTEESLRAMKKSYHEKDIYEAIKAVKQVQDIRVGFSFFAAPPGGSTWGYFRLLAFYFKWNAFLVPRHRGGVALSWARIEPYTELEQIALKDGVISPETDLLPETEDDLMKLFYTNPKLKWTNPVSNFFLDSIDLAARLLGRKVRHAGCRRQAGLEILIHQGVGLEKV